MNLLHNWDKVRQRYIEAWARENHDRPILSITASKSAQKTVNNLIPPETTADRWLDFDWVVKHVRQCIENTYYAGEGYPLFNPNLGPDIFGAILGCELEFGQDTSWCNHPITDWTGFHPVYNRENKWLKRIIQLTEMAVAEARGDFMVGITDIHAGMDALVSLRGPAELCMDLYDCPEEVARLPMELFDVFKTFYSELEAITSHNQEGTSNWMGAWHPGRWYVTSCDFNCMVSNDVFRQYILPELVAQTGFLDANLYHLDGPGALVQLDDLLAVKSINGIQWVPGAGEKAMCEWRDVLMKCQAADKMLHLCCLPSDLPVLAEYLKPEGVILSMQGIGSEQEADTVLKMAEKLWYKKKLWSVH